MVRQFFLMRDHYLKLYAIIFGIVNDLEIDVMIIAVHPPAGKMRCHLLCQMRPSGQTLHTSNTGRLPGNLGQQPNTLRAITVGTRA